MVVRHRDLEFEADMASKSSEDVRMTHAGYLKAVAKDLAYSPILADLEPEARELKVQSIAKSMMGRWKAYAAALEESRKGYVRLSIHDSKGGSKLSMSLLPQARGAIGFTPWHSTVVVELDGAYRTAHVSEVRDTHDLVCVNGRPSHYCAKTDLFDWKADGLDVEFKFLYPTGLRITAKNGASIRDLPAQKVRKLANNFSPVLLSGFNETKDKSSLEAKSNELGQLLGSTQLIHVKNKSPVYEPADAQGEVNARPPYHMVSCISTAEKTAANTLFINSRLFFRYLPSPWTIEKVQEIVSSHKETGVPCLARESWDGADKSLQDMAEKVILDNRVSLRCGLEQGDVLINDDSLVLRRKLANAWDSDSELLQLAFE
jgi:hypothetical protein